MLGFLLICGTALVLLIMWLDAFVSMMALCWALAFIFLTFVGAIAFYLWRKVMYDPSRRTAAHPQSPTSTTPSQTISA
jgi:membrane protein implicated in regulation of membrane protease activity